MTATGVSKDFGRYLQTCRRASGMSLAVVSHQTKITLENLRLIENEQLEQLPAPVFVKGFIRAFAGAVGADPEKALVRLDNKLGSSEQPIAGKVETTVSSTGWRHMALAAVLLLAQILATLYLADWMESPQPMPSQPIAEVSEKHVAPESVLETEPVPEVINAPEPIEHFSEQPHVTAQPQKAEPPATPSTDSLELRMTAVEATWLKVVSDDQKAREFLLKEDQNVTVTAERKFNLVIGNASGIRLVLNDQPVPVRGKSGQVVALHLP